MKNPFKSYNDLTNYKYPVIKLLILVVLGGLCLFHKKILHFNNMCVDIIFLLFLLVCIFLIYISIGEIASIIYKKDGLRIDKDNIQVTKISINDILKLIENNDIIEFKIKLPSKITNIGCSSDCKKNNNFFFDKKYFIDNEEFDLFNDFVFTLNSICNNDYFDVISIDGVNPKYYNFE